MKIAIVGCGALGSYYGAKLCRDGHETHFLLRSDYEVVRRQGVQIESAEGNFHIQPLCARTPQEIGPADVVLIGLKSTANGQFGVLLPPLVNERTSVVTFQNGIGNETAVASVVGAEKTLGGLCYVGVNRIAPGVIRHLGQGLIVLGEYQRQIQERTRVIEQVITHAGIPCRLTDNLEQARWEKGIWNIPFNGLGVASAFGYEAVMTGRPAGKPKREACLATDQLLADANWTQLLRELMMELVMSGNAQGFNFSPTIPDKMIARTHPLGHYKASTVIDFELGKPLELETVFLEPLRRAEKSGVPVPRLEALCRVLAHTTEGVQNSRPDSTL